MGFWRQVFSDGGVGSFGRTASIPTILTACAALVFLVVKNHALPDATEIGALGMFAVGPYTSGKVAGIWASKTPPNA